MYLTAKSLDDLLYRVLHRILDRGRRTQPRKGSALEITGVLLQLSNPRARLSLAERRSVLFGALGELFWYLSKDNKLAFISYYLPKYGEASDDGRTVFGGYGPRLFRKDGLDQLRSVCALLDKHPDSRRAVVQLFDAADLETYRKDIPCTCSLQLLLRDRRLHMLTTMRSNDAYRGLPHDVFAFTMLQELLARSLGVELGTYKHAVGSLHLYDAQVSEAKRYLDQGWQQKAVMPKMPSGNPSRALKAVRKAERVIREGGAVELGSLQVADYWKDIVRLLLIYRHYSDRQPALISELRRQMSSRVYDNLIDHKRRQAARKAG